MTDATSITNRALGAIGSRTTVQNVNTEDSNEAVNARIYYQSTRQEILRAAYWNCARKTVALTLLKAAAGTPENPDTSSTGVWDPDTEPAPPWQYEYAYPSDCLRMRLVTPQINTTVSGTVPIFSVSSGAATTYLYGANNPVAFQIAYDVDGQGNPITVILTNQSQALAVYTVDLINPNAFDAQLTEALVAGLAAYLVIPLTGDKTLSDRKAQEATQKIISARISDGNEGTQTQNFQAAWMQIRDTSFGYTNGQFILPFQNPGFFVG